MKAAIIGATGLVGRELLEILVNEGPENLEISLYASERSEGERIEVGGRAFEVRGLRREDIISFKDGVVFIAGGADIARTYGLMLWGMAKENNIFVIDCSSAFRLHRDVPLVVPEVNGHLITEDRRYIASPNCCATPLALVLHHLRPFGLRRVWVSTYQSISGAGKQALNEFMGRFASGDRGILNVTPIIGALEKDGHTFEERKIILETRKILGMEDLEIFPLAVRVPTVRGHGESVFVEVEKEPDVEVVESALTTADGVKYLPPEEAPEAVPTSIEKENGVWVCRLRVDRKAKVIGFWIISDNLRKGAAYNAFQIFEQVLPFLFQG